MSSELPQHWWTRLATRSVLTVAGDDRAALLQGLLSNDLGALAPGRPVYAALLTPQGKFLFDLMLFAAGANWLADVEAERLDALVRRLTLYRLRAAVSFEPRSELAVYAVGQAVPVATDGPWTAAADPRHPALGQRLIGAPATVEPCLSALAQRVDEAHFTRHRAQLGIPEGSHDLEPDKALLLENGFVELHGVAFDKGCFVGQELTARMRYRATVRKRLLPARLEGEAAPGAPITDGAIEVGQLQAVYGDVGLALIRLDRWRKAADAGRTLQAGPVAIAPWVPDWVDLSFASRTAESSA